MSDQETSLNMAIRLLGGERQAASICGKTVQAIRKWLARGVLPRTEYTGETHYAELLAAASNGAFTAEWLREHARPKGDPSTEAA